MDKELEKMICNWKCKDDFISSCVADSCKKDIKRLISQIKILAKRKAKECVPGKYTSDDVDGLDTLLIINTILKGIENEIDQKFK